MSWLREKSQALFVTCPKTGKIIGLKKPNRLGWLFLPILGLLATIWFLVRVIPKPSRAGYPCMKVAAPLASTFMVYISGLLLSALSIVNFKAWMKKSKYVWAGLFMLTGIFGIAMMTFSHSTKGFTITESEYNTNQPMGVAQGIIPGRVTWVYNPDATNENSTMTVNQDGIIDENDDVYYLPKNNNKDVIDKMMGDAIINLTGAADQAAAWDSLFHYHNRKTKYMDVGYIPGEKIFVKTNNQGIGLTLNMNADLSQSDGNVWGGYPPHMTATSPYAIVALLEQLVNKAGIDQENIYVGDPHTDFNNIYYDIMSEYFPNVHYMGVNGDKVKDCEAYGRTLSIPGDEDVIFYSDHGTVLPVTADKLWQQLQDADYLINIPALKSHIRGGVTLFCKNHFGSHIRSSAEHLHPGLPSPNGNGENTGYGKYRGHVDFIASKYLGGKTMLYVLDGLWGGKPHELREPRKWLMPPFKNDWTSSIFASQDPVAIASVAFDFLRTEYNVETWGDEAYPNMGGVDDYLHQAADSSNWPDGIVYDPDNTGHPFSSLGVHEHWNNYFDKQYTRNLGTGDGIELYPVEQNPQAPTGFEDNFDDNILTGWLVIENHLRTFELTEADSILTITYHRTTESGEWDNFNFTPPEELDLSENPVISVLAKSDISTVLTFKPVYRDGDSDWLQVQLPADTLWHRYVFNLQQADTLCYQVYMYLDGGSTTPATGTVCFDNLQFGDQVSVVATTDVLQDALTSARALVDHLEEGGQEGQVPPGSRQVLQDAIAQTESFLEIDLSLLTQEDVNAELDKLLDACTDFETAINMDRSYLVDSLATRETAWLFRNLQKIASGALLFGMHDATGYGVGWINDDDRSDVKDVCGDYPAVYSEEMYKILRNNQWDRAHYRMTSAYNRGGVLTMCWHQYDPTGTGFYAEDLFDTHVVPTLLPGGENNGQYIEKLKVMARYFKSLRGETGETIPVIFRPYHEHDGGWFWWGVGHCTRDEYNQLWQYTVHYLSDSLNVHNLLYAFSPSKGGNGQAEYLDRYPGDDYVDVFGMDEYFNAPAGFMEKQEFKQRTELVGRLALERNKVAAVTEVGQENIPQDNWFTSVLLYPLETYESARNVAYAAVWRNQDTDHHFAPYPGHSSVPDFLEFYNDPYTLFENDLPNMYGSPDSIHTNVDNGTGKRPESLQLAQNYPNPFNPVSRIEYYLPGSAQVELSIYNVLGQKVMTLVNAKQSAGEHHIVVNARNLSSGVYIYRLQTPSGVLERKMLVIK